MTRPWLVFMRIQATVVVVMLLGIVLITLANIIFRTWGPGSITWADETARLTFVMFSFLAAALACGFGAHLVVSGIADKARGPWKRLISGFQSLMAGIFFFFLMWIGVTQANANLEQTTPAINFPVAVIYGVVAFAGLLMLINSMLATLVGNVTVRDGRIVMGPSHPDLEEVA